MGKKNLIEYDRDNAVHVYPVKDLKRHSLKGIVCACNPKIEIQQNEGVVVVHKAYDHREWFENIKAIKQD